MCTNETVIVPDSGHPPAQWRSNPTGSIVQAHTNLIEIATAFELFLYVVPDTDCSWESTDEIVSTTMYPHACSTWAVGFMEAPSS
jgi:hypothetical protein